MEHWTLKRVAKKETYTIGKLHTPKGYLCDTLEDRVRKGKKVKGTTAIPEGIYRVILTMSPRFKRLLPLLVDVPGFDGVRIHGGNDEHDTEGCVLPGENKVVGKVLNSKYYEKLIIQKIKKAGGEILLTIE